MLEALKYLIGAPGASGYGSKSTAEDVTANCRDLSNITAIITGATSGIGEETARVLAKRGARLILPARTYKAAEDTKARILSECPNANIVVMSLDLSSLSSVRKFVRDFENNAGKFSHGHGITEDGIEMTFATNYLGHFLLTKLLVKKMVETAEETGIQGRIVNVSSSIHSWFTGDLIPYLELITKNKSEYDATRAYALSKLANQMKANVTVNCVHPGIVRTRLTRDREGLITATTCYVATNSRLEKVSGKYFADCNETSPSKLGSNSFEAERLWIVSETMLTQNPKLTDFHL
ncbi:Short-chain dehydrogenase TIC 32 chloroplastic [Bienertia sinuspersici]